MNKKINLNIKKILCYVKNTAYFLLVPAAIMYLFEFFTHNPFATMYIQIQFLNIFLFIMIELFFFFLFGNLKAAQYTEGGIFLVLGVAEYYVYSFRGITILPWDLFSIGTAANVAGTYNYKMEPRAILLIVLFAVLFAVIYFNKVKINRGTMQKKVLVRVIGTLICAGVIVSYANYVQQESTVIKWRMYDKLFTPFVLSKRDGTVTAFMMELQYVSVQKPEGYDPDTEAAKLSGYEVSADAVSDNRISYPNIIVIMDEAFSDPAVLGDFKTNEDYMPFVHSLENGAENTITGYANVSIIGGNTPNSEYEFLTGNTLAFLPEGCIPYQQYLRHDVDAIPEYLSSIGYSTTGMHPYYSNGWDRKRVYPLLGFERMYFIEDFNSAVKYIRQYITDESSFDRIISEYEKRDETKPFFMFNVTMQNHSPYTDDYANFNVDVKVDGGKSDVTDRYLSLIRQTDKAFEELVDYFGNQDDPTIVVIFGDHQPTDSVVEEIWNLNGKKGTELTAEDIQKRYKVPFVIWANYDIDEENGVETSVNYLGNKVLDAAGVPLYPYRQFLEEEAEQYPVLSAIHVVDNKGNDSTASELKDELIDYRRLQYYEMFGKTEKK